MSLFQEIYESEISFSIATLWDAGFEVKIGGSLDDIVAEEMLERWDQIEPWLIQQAILHFPDSRFARSYRSAS